MVDLSVLCILLGSSCNLIGILHSFHIGYFYYFEVLVYFVLFLVLKAIFICVLEKSCYFSCFFPIICKNCPNTLEKYHIYKANKEGPIMNDMHNEAQNPIFEILQDTNRGHRDTV
jgi:hypothetical protein